MAKNKILSRLMPDASLPRNSFDRGFNMKYNFSAGMLLPTFVQYCVGGSKVKINLKNFIRSAAVNTSAMTSVSFFTDFYYVPIRLLFSNFGQFKTRTKDIHSSLFTNIPTGMPRISQSDLQTLYAISPSSDDDGQDIFGFSLAAGRNRLGDLLCYGFDDNSISPIGAIVPLAACAYQKVYFDHYRNTAYEPNDASYYNLDKYNNTPAISLDDAKKYLTLRYCNYRKDMLSNIYPSLNYLSSGIGMQSSWMIPSSVVGASVAGSHSSDYSLVTSQDSTKIQQLSTVQTDGVQFTQSQFSVQTLRAAFALDKLIRASSYAPQHVKDQYQARYGFKPKGYSMDESYRLGSYKSEIIFGEVTSTSDTEHTSGGETTGSSLGQIGGKGVGGSDWQQTISHVCADDCVIIGISYALPRISYDARMVDRFAQKFVPDDFFQPEFMDLGLQPVFFKDFNRTLLNEQNNIILGYQPRYSEYKINLDKNFGLFKFSRPLAAFTMHGRSHYNLSGNAGLRADWFKCCPSDLDQIFVQYYDGDSQTSDQFFGMMEFAFACVAPMSVHGTPRL